MSEKALRIGRWLRIQLLTLDGNHHGPGHTVLRRTWQIVRMGSYAKMWTLYVYRGDGRAHAIKVTFPSWLGEWPVSAGSEPITRAKESDNGR